MSAHRSGNDQVEVAGLAEQLKLEADQLKPEVDRLLDFVRRLQQSSAPTAPNDLRKDVDAKLIDYFETAAHAYVDLANKTITCAARHDPTLPVRFYYGEVLQNIAGHVRLLSQLFVGMGQPPLQQGQISPLDAIQAILWAISRRVPGLPLLVPVLSSQFIYVHLSYVQGVGIIGVPAYALVRPYPDLPILWHEVAGYWVAQLRAKGALLTMAKTFQSDLQKASFGVSERSLWDCYRDLYEQSLLETARVKLKITTDSIRIPESKKIRSYFAHDNAGGEELNIDTDYDWQMGWLGQILEDVFGLSELGETMFESLKIALSRAYEAKDIGDHGHPPPALRLAIADEYLNHNSANNQEINKQDPDATKQLATLIVSHLRPLYPTAAGESRPFDAVVQLIRKLVDAAFGLQGNAYKPEELTMADAIRAVFDEFRAAQNIEIEERIQADLKLDEPCDETVDVQALLERLRRIKFTETDESGPDTGQPPKLPRRK